MFIVSNQEQQLQLHAYCSQFLYDYGFSSSVILSKIVGNVQEIYNAQVHEHSYIVNGLSPTDTVSLAICSLQPYTTTSYSWVCSIPQWCVLRDHTSTRQETIQVFNHVRRPYWYNYVMSHITLGNYTTTALGNYTTMALVGWGFYNNMAN